jgi:hypothetical protein
MGTIPSIGRCDLRCVTCSACVIATVLASAYHLEPVVLALSPS